MRNTELFCYWCGVGLSHRDMVVVQVTDPVEGRERVLIACSGEHLRRLTPSAAGQDLEPARVWAGFGPSTGEPHRTGSDLTEPVFDWPRATN